MKAAPPQAPVSDWLPLVVFATVVAIVFGALAWNVTTREMQRLATAVTLDGEVTGTVEACNRKPRSGKPPICGLRARVRYRDVDGQAREFVSMTGRVPTKLGPGDTVTVIHPPGAPEQVMVLSMFFEWLISGSLWTLTLAFGLTGLGVLVGAMHKIATRRWLARHGEWVIARDARVVPLRPRKGAAYKPFGVVAQWTDPRAGVTREFRSEPFARDPSTLIGLAATVDVLVDPADPRRYWVGLPSSAPGA